MSPQLIPNAAKLACLEKKPPPNRGLPATGFIRQSALIPDIVPISPATLWRWVKSGQFIAPVKLGDNVTAWRCEDVRQWIQAQSEQDYTPTGMKQRKNAAMAKT